jgi:hypothetical protein
MERFTNRWLAFHDEAWSKIKPAGWKRLLQAWPPEARDSLLQLLRDMDDRLAELTRKAQKVGRTVAALRRRLEKA